MLKWMVLPIWRQVSEKEIIPRRHWNWLVKRRSFPTAIRNVFSSYNFIDIFWIFISVVSPPHFVSDFHNLRVLKLVFYITKNKEADLFREPAFFVERLLRRESLSPPILSALAGNLETVPFGRESNVAHVPQASLGWVRDWRTDPTNIRHLSLFYEGCTPWTSGTYQQFWGFFNCLLTHEFLYLLRGTPKIPYP